MIKSNVPTLMEQKGLNITDLMRQANIAYTTAHRIVKGKNKSISYEILSTLCEIFDVQVGDILEYVPDK